MNARLLALTLRPLSAVPAGEMLLLSAGFLILMLAG